MLELMGRGYVIEHCISTFNNIQELKMYRIYSTEMLRVIARTQGAEVTVKYADLIEREYKQEEQDPDEIVSKIRGKLAKVRGETQ